MQKVGQPGVACWSRPGRRAASCTPADRAVWAQPAAALGRPSGAQPARNPGLGLPAYSAGPGPPAWPGPGTPDVKPANDLSWGPGALQLGALRLLVELGARLELVRPRRETPLHGARAAPGLLRDCGRPA